MGVAHTSKAEAEDAPQGINTRLLRRGFKCSPLRQVEHSSGAPRNISLCGENGVLKRKSAGRPRCALDLVQRMNMINNQTGSVNEIKKFLETFLLRFMDIALLLWVCTCTLATRGQCNTMWRQSQLLFLVC